MRKDHGENAAPPEFNGAPENPMALVAHEFVTMCLRIKSNWLWQ